MNMKEELEELLTKMKWAETNSDADAEMCHSEADNLLCKTLNRFAEGVYVESQGMYDFREDVLKIIESFNRVTKWCA